MTAINPNDKVGTQHSPASCQVNEHIQKGQPERERNFYESSVSSTEGLSALSTSFVKTTHDRPQMAPDVSNEHSVVKDVDRPNNTKPTSTAVFHSLGAGMGLAWGTNLLLSSTALLTSAANFLNNDATWSVGIVLFGASWDVLVRLAGRFLPYEKFKKFSQAPNYLASKQNERVRNVIDELDSDGKFAHTIIIPTEKTDNFVFLDRYGRKNVLFFNPLDSAALCERELTNVIAHELAHANKLYTGMLDTEYLMMRVAAPAIFFSTFVSTFNGISSGGFISGTFAAVSGIALGTLYTSAVTLGSRALSAISSRANEIRTDIRAIEMTQDVGGYISALGKVSSKVEGQRSKGPKKPVAVLPSLDSHPSFELRKRYVLRTTEGKR